MSLSFEQTPEQIMYLLQHDVQELRDDVDTLQKAVTGGLDPEKGLLWIVADLVKMVGSLTLLVDAQRQALVSVEKSFLDHKGHERRETPWLHRLAYDCTKQVASILVAGALLLLLLGTQSWIRSAMIPETVIR